VPVDRKKLSKTAKNHFWMTKFFFLHPGLSLFKTPLSQGRSLHQVKLTVKEFTSFVMLSVDWGLFWSKGKS
jgi:hypothetical protein